MRYFAVTVMLAPGVRPVRTDAADARCTVAPASSTEFTSTGATVFPPLMAYDIKHVVELVEVLIAAATEKSTFPVGGTITVCVGPTVARSM
jgi:hypothetical protein